MGEEGICFGFRFLCFKLAFLDFRVDFHEGLSKRVYNKWRGPSPFIGDDLFPNPEPLEALQKVMAACGSAGLTLNTAGHPRQDLCHQASGRVDRMFMFFS